ncbi:MAG: Na+/H+ antiporter NhaC [Planctomycetota bacterium]|jgi:Na+/H+ antiporter NhaC
MLRTLSIALAVFALAALFVLPDARPASLAALYGQSMLAVEVTPPGETGEGSQLSLWEYVLDSPHYVETEAGGARFAIAAATIEDSATEVADRDNQSFVDALSRGLRQYVTGERGLELEVIGPEVSGGRGASFELSIAGKRLQLEYRASVGSADAGANVSEPADGSTASGDAGSGDAGSGDAGSGDAGSGTSGTEGISDERPESRDLVTQGSETGEARTANASTSTQAATFSFPDWRPAGPLSLLPPLIAIALAILSRRPVISLFSGVLAGALLLRWSTDAGLIQKTFGGLQDVVTIFLWREFSDQSRLKVVGFVVAMLAMVGVVTKNGGIRGVMNWVAKYAKSARSTQLAASLMGLVVFFDDYANTILVGSTMRPLTDRFRVAREKLAYIVDSTAAPVAGLSIFSTWIAFEVSTFSAQLPLAGLAPDAGYAVFMETLPYRFYCLLSLAMVFMVAASGRDFGPMLAAERRARSTGRVVREGGNPMVGESATDMEPAPGITIRAWRAVLPLTVFIGATVWTILQTGGAFAKDAPQLLSVSGFSAVLGAADSYEALWYGSLLGFATAVIASLAAGLRLEILDAAWKTLRSMGIALAILYLAWMIGAVCGELGTAGYLTVMLDGIDYPLFLPVVLFLMAGAIAFATGSSWSTMSILLPLVVGLSFTLGERTDIGGHALMVLAIGAVLEGAIFGDHCSPISDTTVLSSVACASDHIDHVHTQAPYSLLVMVVAILAGYLPAALFGAPPALSLLLGVACLALFLRFFGKRSDTVPDTALLDSNN